MDMQAGKFPDLNNRDDLWSLLACITVRKSINQIKSARCQKRPPAEEAVPLDDNIEGITHNVDLRAAAAEQFELMIDALHRKDDLLETIALWKFEGYTNADIARRLGCSSHTRCSQARPDSHDLGTGGIAMTDNTRAKFDVLTLSEAELVDTACDRFETAWRGGDYPCLEGYLDAVPESCRATLLVELIKLEIELRRGRRGPHRRGIPAAIP